jgi:hypothetical protein
MKIQIAIASAVLALAGSIAANAQTSAFSVVVSPTPQTWTGAPLTFGGTITNTTAGPLDISIDSITAPGGVGISNDFANNYLLNQDLTLAPGGSYTSGDLFTVTGPVSASYTGTFSATDVSGGAPGVTGYGDYQVIVPTSSTPEPGTLALFASSALGGGFALLRRRRK